MHIAHTKVITTLRRKTLSEALIQNHCLFKISNSNKIRNCHQIILVLGIHRPHYFQINLTLLVPWQFKNFKLMLKIIVFNDLFVWKSMCIKSKSQSSLFIIRLFVRQCHENVKSHSSRETSLLSCWNYNFESNCRYSVMGL